MASSNDKEPYILAYRHDKAEEHKRLDTQHQVIKYAILDGQLIHPTIRRLGALNAVADLGCGTGAWSQDVASTYLDSNSGANRSQATLIGFDINALAFMQTSAAGVQLLEHDCTQDFDAKYTASFDVVNIRGLAFALPRASFCRLIKNAVHLLKPGGYLQWLETESQLWNAYPASAEISKILGTINAERQDRDLLPDLPSFMLHQLLNSEGMTIINFNLLPGGISRDPTSEGTALDQRFSDTVLESMKLVLESIITRKMPQTLGASEDREFGTKHDALTTIQKLINFVDSTRESGKLMMGGHFPQLIAQKSQE